MEMITLRKASKLTSPNPVTLVCTLRTDGSTNLATVSWWTYLSYNPNMIAFAMGKNAFSGELIRANGKVILTVPGAKIAETVLGCGATTGRNTDKIAKFGIAMQQFPQSDIRIPLHSRVAIGCSLKEFVEVGDHYLYICNVEQIYGNEQEEAVFAWDGYSQIRPAK